MPRLLLALALALAAVATVPASSAGPLRADACAGAPCRVVVYKRGTGGGLVTSQRPGIYCGTVCDMATDYEERMTLTATPDPGSVFTGWMGECEPVVGNQCFLYFDKEKVAIAVFDRVGDPPTSLVPDPGPPSVPATPPPPPPPGCTVGGTPGDDVLYGTRGDDVICSLAGDDHVHGAGGDDVIRAGPGDDELEGQDGSDRLDGGTGNDRLVGAHGRDVLVGARGRDRFLGGGGQDSLRARDGVAELVHGGGGFDTARVDARDVVRAVEKRAR